MTEQENEKSEGGISRADAAQPEAAPRSSNAGGCADTMASDTRCVEGPPSSQPTVTAPSDAGCSGEKDPMLGLARTVDASANTERAGATTPCPDDDELLALAQRRISPERREVLGDHLVGCSQCRHLLEAALGESGEKLEPDATTLEPGSLLSERYEIVRFLGKGGMGEVYEATDLLLQKQVAIKTLLCSTAEDQRAARKLFDEVLNAQKVAHPNVCRINELHEDKGLLSSGQSLPFFTMEFLTGRSLAARLREGPLPMDEACTLTHQMLEGLAAAHARGVLHLDFKSDNVFLRDPGGEAVIMDFGLSRAESGESRQRTSERLQAAGTLPYMALEQLECSRDLGPTADVYAIGVVVYEMLTGHLPFEAKTLSAMLLKQLKQTPKPPSREVPSLSPALDAFVLRCLQRRAADRFADAGAALDALRAVGPWTTEERRPLLRLMAAAALVTGLALAASSVDWGANTASSPSPSQRQLSLSPQGSSSRSAPRESLESRAPEEAEGTRPTEDVPVPGQDADADDATPQDSRAASPQESPAASPPARSRTPTRKAKPTPKTPARKGRRRSGNGPAQPAAEQPSTQQPSTQQPATKQPAAVRPSEADGETSLQRPPRPARPKRRTPTGVPAPLLW